MSNNDTNLEQGSNYKTYSQMSNDERQEFQQLAFAAVKKMAMADISKISRSTSFLSRFKVEEISKWMQNPAQYEKQIRNLSQYLYNISSHYRRFILYISQMAMYKYTLTPDIPDKYDADKLKRSYKKTLQSIETMNLDHEFVNVAKVAFREDFFFGYIHESKDSFFFQKLNPDFCKISSKEDGVFNFAYDFGMFDSNKELLETYPMEFKLKHAKYKNLGREEQWQELDSDKTICIKINEDITEYGLPVLNVIFESIFDLDEYKRMNKSRSKMDNFMLLIQKIPMDEKNPDVNKFLIDLSLAAAFHEKAADAVGDQISMVTSPMDITAVRTDGGSKLAKDIVSNATRDVYSDSGFSQHLFNSDKTTSTGLSSSIQTDEMLVFTYLRQVERWINRRLKKMSGQYKFNFKFLDITVFNQEDKFDMYLKGAQSGLPVITEAAASIGLSPLDLMNKATLENDILGLHNILQPLKSAHTQSNKDKAGRNKMGDDEISDSGQVNRDNNTDENRE